jgi:23S rRNA (guanine745-N1)-methyltransferase
VTGLAREREGSLSMVPLSCTVRGCAEPLAVERGRGLRCPRGHGFDRAREGYFNLLQPHDRRSAHAGDSDAAIEARRRWLARGFADALVRDIGEIARIPRLPPGAVVADVGCGDGFFARRLLAGSGVEACGIDLSVRAVRLASRAWPDAVWVVANADRFVPLLDGSVDLALSLFGRRPASELARVLRPGGALVVAVPAADDLVELRSAALGAGSLRDRVPAVVRELEAHGFRCVERRTSRDRAHLDRQAIEDALALTYRGARTTVRERVDGLQDLDVTLSAVLLRFERSVVGTGPA